MTDVSASLYGPVTDWATDFDHADPEYNPNAHEIWADLREHCPVAHSRPKKDRDKGIRRQENLLSD